MTDPQLPVPAAIPADRAWTLLADTGPFAAHAAAIYSTLDDLGPGEQIRFGFRVAPHHCNLRPQCHGGMLCTFLDVALARGLHHVGQLRPPFPTMSLSMEFMASAALGSWVDARVSVGRIGRSTGFVSALIHADDVLAMRGSGVFRHYSAAATEA